ncbi:MAG: hypothetical protein ACUVQ0_07095 [Thermoproteota archaeon]
MDKNILRIVEAYGIVLSEVSGAMFYLLYLTAAIFSGMLLEILMLLLGPSVITMVIGILIFLSSFTAAGLAGKTIERISITFESTRAPKKGIKPEKAEQAIPLFWVFSFVFAYAVSIILIPGELYAVMFSTAIGLGVSLGNLGIFLSEWLIAHRTDFRPLFVFLYLLLTSPSYILVPNDPYPFILCWTHLAFSYFAVALWYVFSARRKASVILHAARGAD